MLSSARPRRQEWTLPARVAPPLRGFLVALSWAAAGCVALPTPDGQGGDDDGGADDDGTSDDDATAGDDDATADDDATGDDDATTDDDATGEDDDATADDDDSIPPYEDVHGGVYVVAGSGDYGFDYATYTASATFYDVSDTDPEDDPSEVLDPQEGMDDCGLLRIPLGGGGSTVTFDYRSAGAVGVRSGPQDVEMLPQSAGDTIYYSVDLAGLGFDPRWGQPYSFRADGDEVPAFDVDPGAVLPEPLEVTAPDLSYEADLARATTTFRWTGSGDEALAIGISAQNAAATWAYSLYCRANDDGQFAVPGDLMAQLPTNVPASVYVQRGVASYVALEADYWITIGALTAVYAYLHLD